MFILVALWRFSSGSFFICFEIIGNKGINEEGNSGFRNVRCEDLKELCRKAICG